MIADGGSPTVRRRRLGLRLRELREALNITGAQAGAEVDRSASWISRVELGRIGLRPRELAVLLDLYKVERPGVRAELEELAQEGRQRAWWSRYRDSLPEPYLVYLGLEAEAESVWSYEGAVIPGLLQTEEYARAIHRDGLPPLDDRLIEDRVFVRMTRQQVLEAPRRLRLDAIVDEAAIRKPIGGVRVLREQLIHLQLVAKRPNVTFGVVPLGSSMPAAVLSITVLEFGIEEPRVVYVEDHGGGVFVRGTQADVYYATFDRIREVALGRDESIHLVRRICDSLAAAD
jgi:transcriptional regulator with XRE-family HTH domain